jgi:hypothetical protein
MSDVVFAVYDLIPDDDNKLSRLFAAFLSVYMILNQRRFTEECLDALHEKLKIFHRQPCFAAVFHHVPHVPTCFL